MGDGEDVDSDGDGCDWEDGGGDDGDNDGGDCDWGDEGRDDGDEVDGCILSGFGANLFFESQTLCLKQCIDFQNSNY